MAGYVNDGAWGLQYRSDVLEDTYADRQNMARAADLYNLQAQDPTLARQVAAAQMDQAAAQASAAGATGTPAGSVASLQGLSAAGTNIAGQAAAQAASDSLAARQGAQQAYGQHLQGYLGAEQQGLGYVNLAMQDQQNANLLQQEYLKQQARQQARAAQAQKLESDEEAMVTGAFLSAAGSTVGSMGSSSGGGSDGSSSLSGSDVRMKTGAEADEPGIDRFMRTLTPYSYRYKDPAQDGAAPGPQTGVMAQDLERSAIGRRYVQEGTDGLKRVDYQSMGPVLVASLARLNERLDQVEGRKKPAQHRPAARVSFEDEPLQVAAPEMRGATVIMRPSPGMDRATLEQSIRDYQDRGARRVEVRGWEDPEIAQARAAEATQRHLTMLRRVGDEERQRQANTLALVVPPVGY